ncbi:23S ribosomal RNA methyltransferase Erm [Thermoflavimicrobium dichotomicum]|uniref:rRNA adenine N-6-methyltransferase n=1 Tax=Thermoflavimicrobium dichotomicum TaxID=46223 RepID=A0A1I3S802_9BACL|nr:23S ribosomal RNA methyltransferase Erm [Thermoflavimicrobium dichotomicum]SFJ54818.1 23S rRNA (adenine-N6)-dimethyltransferase [Thermoflavimicrobium dichotomicum]
MHTRNKRLWRNHKEGSNFPGQHLIYSKRLAQSLIEMAGIGSNDLVLDIGAGKGALTLPLAQKAGRVLAIENDPQFVQKLRVKLDKWSHVTIIERDILQVNLPRKPFCVVASIPYSITTPILGKLMDQPATPLKKALLVIEKGAAKRFTANPTTNPRILKWRMFFDLKMGRTLSPDHFSPPPRVDSAVLFINRKEKPFIPVRGHALFSALASHGLKIPEWPVYEALRGVFTPPQISHLLKELGIERDFPIGWLSIDQWATIFHSMIRHVKPYRWPTRK